MDKEQAIETLRANYPDACYEQLREAVDAAIEALKAQLSQQGTTSDLISRQAVINAIENTNAKMSMPEWDEITNAVMSLPTIQPEPQEGHWINGKCDLCGEHAPFWAMASTYHESKYCPNCGAKMKGVKHETD